MVETPSDLSDDELLERLAGQDHALAPVAEQLTERQRELVEDNGGDER